MPGSWLFTCISSDTMQGGERLKLYQENKDAIKINEAVAVRLKQKTYTSHNQLYAYM